MQNSVVCHFILLAFAFCARGDDTFSDIRTQCNDTFPTPSESFAHLLNFGSFPDESDKTAMCFVHCLMDRTGMIDTEGTFQPAVLVDKLQGFPNGTEIPDLVQIVEYCVTQNEMTDLCEKAYDLGKCLMQQEIQRHGERAKEE